jgi:hypothetical protein
MLRTIFPVYLALLLPSLTPAPISPRVYEPYLDVLPLPTPHPATISLPVHLDNQPRSVSFRLGDDPELAALTEARPMGKLLSEVHNLSGEIKRLTKNSFTATLDQAKPNFVPQAAVTYASPSALHIFLLVSDPHSQLSAVVKAFQYTPDHLSLTNEIASILVSDFSFAPLSASSVALVLSSAASLTSSSGWFYQCPSSPSAFLPLSLTSPPSPPPSCSLELQKLVSNLPILAQGDYDQSFAFHEYLSRHPDSPLPMLFPPTQEPHILEPKNPLRAYDGRRRLLIVTNR